MSRHAAHARLTSEPLAAGLARRLAPWLVAMGSLILLAAFSAPAFPMSQEEPAEASAPEEEPAVQDDAAVQEILRQQEELLRGQQFSYDPENRRDPFRSLFEKSFGVKLLPRIPYALALDLVGEAGAKGAEAARESSFASVQGGNR